MGVVPYGYPMIEFHGIAKIARSSLFGNASKLRSIFVEEERAAEKSSYVDLDELDEALGLYYLGLLDEVNVANANDPLRELVPGKTLISQLDQADMSAALEQLDVVDYYILESCKRFNYIPTGDHSYLQSLEHLAAEVLKIL